MKAAARSAWMLAVAATPVAGAAATTPDAGVPDHAPPQRWAPAAITSDRYESSPVFTADGREMYFMRADPAFRRYELLVSRCGRDGWSTPSRPAFAQPGADEGDPGLSADGRRLYFISTRHFPGKRGSDFDIWVVEREAGADWGTPTRLPEPVNSPQAELLPRLDAEGALVFGSDRPGGLGGQDIHRAVRDDAGRWQVRNLGAPVNTAANEYEADVSADGRALVVVSDRDVRSHLFRYTLGADGWRTGGRIHAREDVFQVGPLLSPRGDRLLFAQAHDAVSGELFVVDLDDAPDRSWPPDGRCGG